MRYLKIWYVMLFTAIMACGLAACGDDDDDKVIVDPITDKNVDKNADEEIVVTIDANGNADGGHQFTRIDETTFLIDGLKYKYESLLDFSFLWVIGYDPVFFNGRAKVISKLKYNGLTMAVAGIKDNAFRDCTGLTSITIGSGVASIGKYAFSGCSRLTSVTIGKMAIIEESAFFGCENLTSVTIGFVASIEEHAFSCTGLTSIAIPNGVTSIGDYAFSFCTSPTSITIPNSVTYIGYGAFCGCSGLTSIMVESGNTVYDSRNNCNAIIKTASNTLIAGCKNTTIPNSVISIGYQAFLGQRGLTSITIPNSVTSIGVSAFDGCTGLTSVTIGSGVTSIGYGAFEGCSSLTNVYCYAENVPSVESRAFYKSSYSSATLHVPASSVDAYKAAEPWKYFKTIVAIE